MHGKLQFLATSVWETAVFDNLPMHGNLVGNLSIITMLLNVHSRHKFLEKVGVGEHEKNGCPKLED